MRGNVCLIGLDLNAARFESGSLVEALMGRCIDGKVYVMTTASGDKCRSCPTSFSGVVNITARSSFFSSSLGELFLKVGVLNRSRRALQLCKITSIARGYGDCTTPFMATCVNVFFVRRKFRGVAGLCGEFSGGRAVVAVSRGIRPS